jgi:hypothetical protein
MFVIQKGTNSNPIVVISNGKQALKRHPNLFEEVKELGGDIAGELHFSETPLGVFTPRE